MFNFKVLLFNKGRLFKTKIISKKKAATFYKRPVPGAVYSCVGGWGPLRKKRFSLVYVSSKSWSGFFDGSWGSCDEAVASKIGKRVKRKFSRYGFFFNLRNNLKFYKKFRLRV
jgi:hypothetical protein